MQESIISTKRTAKLAGLLYLILAITGFYGLMYVPGKTVVKEDAVATAAKILGNQFLFRTGIMSQLISVIAFLFMAFVLYKLFKKVNDHRAKVLVGLIVVQVPIVFVMESFKMMALVTLKGEVAKTLNTLQSQEMALIFLKMYSCGITALEIFWGLWLIPFGQLVYKSLFIPRVFGVLLVLAGIGYTLDSFTGIVFPQYRFITRPVAFTFSGLGEVSTILWLLIKGVSKNENTDIR